MKMTNQMPNDRNDAMLDDLFDLARGTNTEPSDALMARIINDADAQIPTPQNAPVQAMDQVSGSLLVTVLDLIGGWKSLGGLATATATGLWIGISPPTAFEDYTADYFTSASTTSSATIDSLMGFDTLYLEDDA